MWFDPCAPLNEDLRYDHGEGCCLRGETPDTRGRLYVRRIFSKKHGTYGWLYHCFNCGWSGFKPQLSQYIPINNHPLSERLRDYELPEDCTYDFPKDVLDLLYTYNLTDTLIAVHQIKWSPSMQRIILPLFIQDTYKGYQARRPYPSLDKKNPKYLTFKPKGEDVWWESYIGDEDYVVIVEDIISAIVVSEVAPSVALLGTRFPHDLALRVWPYQIILWLDPDYAGRKRTIDLLCELSYLPHTIRVISGHEYDPKMYTKDQIREFIRKTGVAL